jgi:Beta-lactamase
MVVFAITPANLPREPLLTHLVVKLFVIVVAWFIHDTRDGETERQFEHSGGVAGSSSWLVIYPDQGVVIAWVQNSNDFRDWPIANVSAPFFSHRK